MESGKVYRTNPFNKSSRARTLTISESGMLHKALMRRKKEEVMTRYRRMRSSRIRRMFTRDLDKTIQKATGRTLAKVVYGMWRKGYFAKYDEFSDQGRANAEAA